MAYYDVNVLLALPSGGCTCRNVNAPSADCPHHTIVTHTERVRLSMSRWVSPNVRVKDAKDHAVRHGPNPAESVTIDENKDVPDESDRWLFDLVNGAPRSRLTIFGHCDNKSGKVGGRSPEALAELVKIGCRIRRVTKISLLACYGGGNTDSAQGQPGHLGASESFAKRFHEQLVLASTGRQLFVDLSARTRGMSTDVNGVRKALMPDNTEVRSADTKYLFSWVDTVLDGQVFREQKIVPRGKV